MNAHCGDGGQRGVDAVGGEIGDGGEGAGGGADCDDGAEDDQEPADGDGVFDDSGGGGDDFGSDQDAAAGCCGGVEAGGGEGGYRDDSGGDDDGGGDLFTGGGDCGLDVIAHVRECVAVLTYRRDQGFGCLGQHFRGAGQGGEFGFDIGDIGVGAAGEGGVDAFDPVGRTGGGGVVGKCLPGVFGFAELCDVPVGDAADLCELAKVAARVTISAACWS
ncbi:hypothetical protein [Nocardia sp. NPDC002869]|uniref:hypothetical protein n=1 Tax=Nocardia sp. NPDC002869 TaxID=3161032 RepID=UPI00398CD760